MKCTRHRAVSAFSPLLTPTPTPQPPTPLSLSLFTNTTSDSTVCDCDTCWAQHASLTHWPGYSLDPVDSSISQNLRIARKKEQKKETRVAPSNSA